MEYFDNRIVAKSTNENFEKEKSGIKNNTIREFNPKEYNEMMRFKSKLDDPFIQYIVIRNSETGETFEREISDITFFKKYNIEENYSEEGQNKVKIRTVEIYIFIISFKEEEKSFIDDEGHKVYL